METPDTTAKSLEELINEKSEVAKQIMDLDAKGDKGEEWNRLSDRHEALTEMIENMPNEDEMHKTA